MGTMAELERYTGGSYGAQFKRDARRYYGSFVSLSGRGEMIPNPDCFCELDPTVKDRWGIPVLRFHWKWSEHELRQADHMQSTFASIFEAMGGKAIPQSGRGNFVRIRPGGNVKHEVGGTMMGSDAKTSVTNRWGQTWDVKNLFVADGGTFCSSADKNPTLTIMALSWRTADYILAEMKRGNI
jgi:choline dehydrogenase-like flavoprotein